MNEYPDNWPEIATALKEKHGWCCERCKHPHEIETGYVLTVHHLDGNKANCADWNLAVLCQRCHLTIQGRVTMDQGFFEALLPVSEWFKPHLEGYRASNARERLGRTMRCHVLKCKQDGTEPFESIRRTQEGGVR